MQPSTTELLTARRALYDLLARLYLRPPDTVLLEELRSLPGFADVSADPDAVEALQVEYEFVFGRNVYPYESLYLNRELMLNTAAAERVAQLYDDCGFTGATHGTGASDHLGLELQLMAHLLANEIAAWEHGDRAAIVWAQAQQARCLYEHLALWAPVCGRAIERIATCPFFQTAARLTVELILSDLQRVPLEMPPTISLQATQNAPHQSAEQEDEDERGINRVVRQLITPDAVGIFLSRADLSALGRLLHLPLSIGERFQMLRGLFEAAGQFELVAPLIDELIALLAAESEHVEAMADSYPAWGEAAQHWRARLPQGRALLDELHSQALGPQY